MEWRGVNCFIFQSYPIICRLLLQQPLSSVIKLAITHRGLFYSFCTRFLGSVRNEITRVQVVV